MGNILYIKGFIVSGFHYDSKSWKQKDLYSIAKHTMYKGTIKN